MARATPTMKRKATWAPLWSSSHKGREEISREQLLVEFSSRSMFDPSIRRATPAAAAAFMTRYYKQSCSRTLA